MAKLPEAATLKILRRACLGAAAAKFAGDPSDYAQLHYYRQLPSKLYGHCGPVAYTVRAVLGGDIVTGFIYHDETSCRHYWNRLPSGEEVDLTSCQFGGDGVSALQAGKKVKARKPVPLPFLLFIQQVIAHL